MTALLSELTTQAASIVTNVGLAAIAGVSIGLTIFGIKKVYRTFKSM